MERTKRERTETDRTERVRRIMESVPREDQALGAGGTSTYDGLLRADQLWAALRSEKPSPPPPDFVTTSPEPLAKMLDYDVAVCGGTLGIFMATALAKRGFKVAVIERGALRGRKQEWNISEQELRELVAAGVLGEEDISAVIGVRFNPLRAGFKRAESDPRGVDTYCPDVLNLGVRPSVLVERARARFEAAGGTVLEGTPIGGVSVRPDGAALDVGEGGTVTARLVLDCMGNASPMVRQRRWGIKPDGVCLVVGSCARGFDPTKNTAGDVIYANTPVIRKDDKVAVQYFWEAFPAGSGPADKTTYMFAYMDAEPERISLVDMMDDYFDLMPKYQGVKLEDLEFLRVLYGCFPTYKESPLPTNFDRVCQIGDAGGTQSPLSFGGFACLTRHIKRLTEAFSDALDQDLLDQDSLRRVNEYLPSLSATWMFQRSMSVGVGERMDENLIVDLLSNNFKSMNRLAAQFLFSPPYRLCLFLSYACRWITTNSAISSVGCDDSGDCNLQSVVLNLTAAENLMRPCKTSNIACSVRRVSRPWQAGTGHSQAVLAGRGAVRAVAAHPRRRHGQRTALYPAVAAACWRAAAAGVDNALRAVGALHGAAQRLPAAAPGHHAAAQPARPLPRPADDGAVGVWVRTGLQVRGAVRVRGNYVEYEQW
ncbi:unnamed protein product [Phaeothamnion confervicola]